MVSRSPSNAATEANPLLDEALQHKFDQAKLEQDNVAHDSPNATEESFELVKLALPIIATLILEFLPGAFAVAVVGHIDSPLKKEFVDAATLSVMFLNITGLSIGFGLSTAMDTLCSQTVGAGKLYNLGMYFQSGLIVLGSMFIPAWIINYNTEFFLLALGQDPTVAALAGSFSKISVFAMPGVFLYELIKKVLQAQKIVSPMAYIAVLTNLVYFGLGYYLCYETDIGFLGAAYARAISQSLLPIFAYLYLLWNPVHKDWWPTDHGFSAQWKAAWDHVPEFFSLGVPGMLMMILEWWAFELCEVIAGWMPNPVLSISVQSVLMSLASQAFSIYLGINIATTVRLGNALGANEPNRAHMISNVALCISLAAGVFMSIVFLITRDFLPRAFISDPTSIAAIQHALAIFAVYEIIDCLNNASQSILKGMGKQSIGAWVNAMAYYVLGIPFGMLLAFHFNLGVEGLWIGLASGLLGAFCLFFWYICRVNWKAIAIEAVTRTSK